MRRTVISVSLVAALGIGTAACASSTRSTSDTHSTATSIGATTMPTVMSASGSTAHNDADVTFVKQMIPHHQQALTMAAMALDTKAGASAGVKALATEINAAQTAEIEMMQGWLDQWAVPMTDSTTAHGMGGSAPMATSMGTMGGSDGMMSDADMHAMAATTGQAFDTMWLTGMIAHHQGAIAMANIERQTGTSTDALHLADSIATGQAVEVTEMQQLLAAG
jgi:uncharacterized protein (DUF305 family)